MPKLTIKSLQTDIETLRELRIEDKRDYSRKLAELESYKRRVADIAKENESLLMDKRWLQSMLSNTIQTLPEIFRNRNALSR